MTARLGVTLPQFTGDRERLVSAARRARAAGLDSVWLFDHLWPLSGGRDRPILECWTTLAYVAEHIEDITVGTLVTRSTIRNPAVLAAMAATAAAIAPGRIVVAVGSGDEASRAENVAFGLPYFAGDARIRQLEETVATVRGHLDGAGSWPRPPGERPPVWIGARSRGALEAAGRSADGWNAWGVSPAEFARGAAVVRAAAGARRVELTWGGLVAMGTGGGAAGRRLKPHDGDWIVGDPSAIAARLADLAAAGAGHLICTFPDAGKPGAYEMLGERVRPALDRSRGRD